MLEIIEEEEEVKDEHGGGAADDAVAGAKIQALVNVTLTMGPTDKLVVFSSFTKFLDLARAAVDAALVARANGNSGVKQVDSTPASETPDLGGGGGGDAVSSSAAEEEDDEEEVPARTSKAKSETNKRAPPTTKASGRGKRAKQAPAPKPTAVVRRSFF